MYAEDRFLALAGRLSDGDAVDWIRELGEAATVEERRLILALRAIHAERPPRSESNHDD